MNRRRLLSFLSVIPFIGGASAAKAASPVQYDSPFWTPENRALRNARDLMLPGFRSEMNGYGGDFHADYKRRCLVLLLWDVTNQRSAIRQIPEAYLSDYVSVGSHKARFRPLMLGMRGELKGPDA